MNVLAALTSLFAPDDCLSCGREGRLLCERCARQLPSLPGRCYRCYAKITTGVSCADCLTLSGFASMQAAVQYGGMAQELIARLKFQGSQSAVLSMSQAMLREAPDFPATSVLVPIPATAQHVRQRGHDQAMLLARALSRRTRLPVVRLLARRGRAHQLGAGREQRLQQLTGALRVINPELVCGRPIILIDDVLTTGASLQAAATVLRAAGARQISAWVFAQA